MVSFKKHNPDWTLNLWMPKVSEKAEAPWITTEQKDVYTGKDFLSKAKKLCNVQLIDFKELGLTKAIHEVQKADIVRWYLLFTYGGVWSDVDILYIKPIDSVLKEEFGFAFVYHENPYIGFYIAKPAQSIFETLFNDCVSAVRRNMNDGYQSLGADRWRQFGSPENILRQYPEGLNLPMEVVYPYTASEVDDMLFGSSRNVTSDTIGLHWYNGSPKAKQYQNKFDKYINNDSVVSQYAWEYV